MVGLDVGVKAKGQRAVGTQLEVRAENALTQLGIVGLQRCSVLTGFVEIRAARENFAVLADFSSDHQIGGAVLGAGASIHRAAIGFGDQNVTVSVKDLARESRLPFSFLAAGPQGKIGGVLIAVRSFDGDSTRLSGARNELHHAAQRVAAIKAGRALLRDLHGGYGFYRDAIPVHPAAERIVQRDSILKHERAAGAVCA